MEEKSGKKVLIIGSSATEYTLAKKMSELKEIEEVFVAPGNDAMKEFSTIVDIRENNIQELLEFALESAIDLTIASGEDAIKSNIASLFQTHNQMIFAPSKNGASICMNKSTGKKFMYKNQVPCPKFGIFEKASFAIDYIKKSELPIVIKTDEHQNKGTLVCNTDILAQKVVEEFFELGEKKVIIEDYIPGHEFSFYVITDGYHALPLGTVATYKHDLEGGGGTITNGMGAFTPDYKISKQIEQRIMGQIIYPTLNTLAREQNPYIGILGVDLVMPENEQIYALEFNSFLQSPDCQCILSLLNENLYHLFTACVIGSFADDYENLDISENCSVSLVLNSRKEHEIIKGLDNLDEETGIAHFGTKKNIYLEYETTAGRNLILTRTARVLSKAVEDLYEETSILDSGLKYRKDIAKV